MNQTATTRFLIELRKRLVWSLVFLSALLLITIYFANSLYTWLALPLLKQLPSAQHLVAINIVSAFFTPVEFAFYVAVFLAIPVFIYQAWAFVAPALYAHEKRLFWPLILASIVLFYVGISFAYFIIFPILFAFLAHTVPVGVQLTPDVNQYLDFTLSLFFIFGFIFEIPVLIILLVKTKITTRQKLVHLRPYVIVGAFVVGMLVAPPDVLSQTLVALPLWWLYEIGVFLLRILK